MPVPMRPLSAWVVSPLGFVLAMLLMPVATVAEDIRYIDPSDADGSSAAVVVPDLPQVHTAQFLPFDTKGKLIGNGRAREQIEAVLANLESAIRLGDPPGNSTIVKLNVVATNVDVVDEVRRALAARNSNRGKPAVSYVIGKLTRPDALVGIDAVAISPRTAARGVVTADPKNPAEVAVLGPGPRVYVSGQTEKGKDIVEMTRRTMESLAATLEYLGLDWKDVVQVKSFIGPMTAVAEAEREIKSFFKDGSPIPPLIYVEWTTEPSIEIELIAGRDQGTGPVGDSVEFITPPGMTPSPVYSRVARLAAGPTIYTSGLYGDSQENGDAETREIFAKLSTLMEKSGSDMRHLAKAMYYVATPDATAKLGAIRAEIYDPKRPPGASKAPVTGTGRQGRTITLDMIAAPRPK